MKSLLLLCGLATALPAATLKAKVVGVKTGADLEILAGGQVVDLKLKGIECAARTHPAGKAARRFAAGNAFMNDVTVELAGTAPDGTWIGKVSLADGRDLGAELIKAGLAWRDMQGNPEDTGLAGPEREAREARLGVWAGASDDDEEEEDLGRKILARRGAAGGNGAALLSRADTESRSPGP